MIETFRKRLVLTCTYVGQQLTWLTIRALGFALLICTIMLPAKVKELHGGVIYAAEKGYVGSVKNIGVAHLTEDIDKASTGIYAPNLFLGSGTVCGDIHADIKVRIQNGWSGGHSRQFSGSEPVNIYPGSTTVNRELLSCGKCDCLAGVSQNNNSRYRLIRLKCYQPTGFQAHPRSLIQARRLDTGVQGSFTLSGARFERSLTSFCAGLERCLTPLIGALHCLPSESSLRLHDANLSAHELGLHIQDAETKRGQNSCDNSQAHLPSLIPRQTFPSFGLLMSGIGVLDISFGIYIARVGRFLRGVGLFVSGFILFCHGASLILGWTLVIGGPKLGFMISPPPQVVAASAAVCPHNWSYAPSSRP